jgi:hypothetical protein
VRRMTCSYGFLTSSEILRIREESTEHGGACQEDAKEKIPNPIEDLKMIITIWLEKSITYFDRPIDKGYTVVDMSTKESCHSI